MVTDKRTAAGDGDHPGGGRRRLVLCDASNRAAARLLIENNASEEATAARVQGIYDQVERQVYGFLAATLAAIVVTSFFLIRSNRRLFATLASLSEERRELARQLITARESTLR